MRASGGLPRPRTELRARRNPPPAPARDPGARGAVLWRVQRPARPARRCRSGALAGRLEAHSMTVQAPGFRTRRNPTHEGPGKPPDAFQPRRTLPEHTNSPRQPTPKQTGKPAPPGRGTKRQSMPGPQPNPTDPPPHRGAPGGRPPGKNCEPLARPQRAEHRATPGGYGGKPPGVAIIGVPTGARNAGMCSDGGPEHRFECYYETDPDASNRDTNDARNRRRRALFYAA